MDQLAHELGMDPLELRRKNFIPPHDEPHETPIGVVYDSGNYDGTLDKLLEHVDVAGLPRRAGASCAPRASTAGSGSARTPRSAASRRRASSARAASACRAAAGSRRMVRVHTNGAVTVYTGTSPHGQGHETGFAQIVADRLGVDPQQVEVVHGDTATGPEGLDTYGSRTLAVGGEAVARAAEKVADEGEGDRRPPARGRRRRTSRSATASSRSRARRTRAMTLAEIAGAAYIPREPARRAWSPGSRRRRSTTRRTSCSRSARTRASSTSTPRRARSKVVRYVAVDDCGPAINPMLIDGQVHGGIAHGDRPGAVRAGRLRRRRPARHRHVRRLRAADRRRAPVASRPTAPRRRRRRTRSASRASARPARSPPRAAVTNAVIDALRPLGVTYIDMPLTPMRVWQAIHTAAGPAATEQGKDVGEHGQGSSGSGPASPTEGGAQ